MEGSGLCEYERERARTIAANNAKLASLGLPLPALPLEAPKRRCAPSSARSAPVRKSARCAAIAVKEGDDALGLSVDSIDTADAVPWELGVFRELEQSRPLPQHHRWDARRCHQHLTISKQGTSVATTGVAGYGIALCMKPDDEQSWSVRVARLGVGGFAIGMIPRGAKAPYKSLGKRPDAVGAYHSNGLWTSHGTERPFGQPYATGDVIDVLLRPTGRGKGRELAFCKNGDEVGVIPGIPTGDLVLAVQPYMGGVASFC